MNEQQLQAYLQRRTGRPLMLRMNTNLHALVTTRRRRGCGDLRVSLHRIFLDAPHEVLRAVAAFIVAPDADNRETVRHYISTNSARVAACRRITRTKSETPEGSHYDLAAIAEKLNRRYFDGRLKFDIVWSSRPRRPARRLRQVTLGVCHTHQRLIRIHPMLDDRFVPACYLEFVVFHEMTHLVVPSTVTPAGRLRHHTPDFYTMERQYARYREAHDWERRHFATLLARWSGRKLVPSRRVDRRGAGTQLQLF